MSDQPTFTACRCPDEGIHTCRRTVAKGAVHIVRQCRRCGRQVGSALGKKALGAAGQLGLPDFDPAIEERYHQLALQAFAPANSLAPASSDPIAPEVAARMKLELEARESLAALCGRLIEDISPSQLADALGAKAIELRRAVYNANLAITPRFADEPALKRWLVDHLAEDFELTPEVAGRHLAEGVRVEIDFMAFPKPHLIDAGFVPRHFGIEVKHINQEDGFSRKASRALWQTVSYTDSEFEIGTSLVKPTFAMLFSNLSFEAERLLLRNFGSQRENDLVLWRGLLQLANHANVGTLDIRGTATDWRGWAMRFSTGGTYFSRRHSRSVLPVYRKSNGHLVDKVRVGNF